MSTPTFCNPGRRTRRSQILAQLRRDVVEEGGRGRHAAAEDGRGELGGGPEGGRLQIKGLVRGAGVEGDDEAHDGGDAGAVIKGGLVSWVCGWRSFWLMGMGWEKDVQQANGEDGQDADFAARRDFELGDAVEGEEEDRKVGDDVNGGRGDEGGQEVDAAALDRVVPDAGAGHALEDGGAEVWEVKGKVGPDEDVDEVVGFTVAGGVEEAAVHEEDGEFGEEDGGTVDHFGRVAQLEMRVSGCSGLWREWALPTFANSITRYNWTSH